MSVVPRQEEYITTLWNDGYSIVRADYKLYDSYVYAIVQSKAEVCQVIEVNGGLAEDHADDTRREFDKVLQVSVALVFNS